MRAMEGKLNKAVTYFERLQKDLDAQREVVQSLTDDLSKAEQPHNGLVQQLAEHVGGDAAGEQPTPAPSVPIEDILQGKELPINLDSLLAPEA
eukprot:1577314-Pyramimonas_sp.AAC.1